MALADILAGLSEAGHQHRTTLLQMDYDKRNKLADLYGKLAEDENYPEEARSEFLNRAVQIHTLPPEKKMPKEWENMTLTISPPKPKPIQTQGSEGTNAQSIDLPGGESVPQYAQAAIEPQTVQPPTPPPTMRSAYSPLSFDERLDRQGRATRQEATVKTDVQLEQYQRLYKFWKSQGLPDLQAASLASGRTPPTTSYAVPGTVDEKEVLKRTGETVPPGHYALRRLADGSWDATPVESKVSGGLKFAQNEQDQWVGYTTDQYGKVNVQSNLGLTPPQGVPTDSIQQGVRIVPTRDGGYAEVPVTQVTSRYKSGGLAPTVSTVEAPTAPPNMAQPQQPVQPQQLVQPQRPSAGAGPGREISGVGKSLTPNQMQSNDEKAQSFDNMIERMTGVLDKADLLNSLWTSGKIAFATDPAKPGKLILSRTAGLTPEEAKFAADYISLGEDINLLRGVFQATGFRGPEAFATQQAQRGPLLGDPQLFRKVLMNSMKASVDQLSSINRAQTEAGRPVQLTDGLLHAYLILNNNNENAALAALKRDGWQVQ